MTNQNNVNTVIKILYLEDSKQDFELIYELLIVNGFELKMDRVENEQGFVSALISQKYDIILSDFNLPTYDAFRSIKKSIELCPEIPIIIVSGTVGDETAIELIKQGAIDYVLKDKPERLPSAIKRALQEADKKRELKLIQKTLQENEERYRQIYQFSADSMIIHDLEMNILDVNNKFEDVFGYSKAELLKMTVFDLHPKSSLEHSSQMLAKIKKISRIKDEEFFRKKDGTVFLAEISPCKYSLADKPIILTVIRDITKRKKDEIELKMRSMAIEQSVEAVVITNIKGNIQYINPAFEKICGYSSDEIIGQNPRILKSGKQDDDLYKNLWKTISKGQIWRGNLINSRKDGSLYTENAVISPLLDDLGNITHYVGVKRDISIELDLQQQLIQSQKLESIGTLAGGVAHDFNNILTIIKSYCELLLLKLSDTEFNEYVQRIDEAADKATALTKQLLAFSREQILIMEPINLNDLVRNIEEIMKRLMGEEYHLYTDLQAEPSIIKADAHQIEQIIMNLCVNARDAMPHGGKIFIRTRNIEDTVALIVEDSGEGMPPEIISHIFEPFFTTKGSDKGTGLGLSVIFGIVKQHQGEIFVESTPGKGSRFCIKLNSSDITENNKKELLKDNSYSGGKNILILEDDERIREISQINFEENNFTVFPAESIKTAYEIFKLNKDKIDIVFSDVVLPDGSGLDFVDRISPLKKDLKIILTSGYTDEKSHLDRIIKKGFQFIQKPYKINDILQLISAGKIKEVNNE